MLEPLNLFTFFKTIFLLNKKFPTHLLFSRKLYCSVAKVAVKQLQSNLFNSLFDGLESLLYYSTVQQISENKKKNKKLGLCNDKTCKHQQSKNVIDLISNHFGFESTSQIFSLSNIPHYVVC